MSTMTNGQPAGLPPPAEGRFHLTVFGGLQLSGPEGSVATTIGKRRLVLLAMLAASGERGISRDILGSWFWPESDEAHARGALKQAIYALRTELTPETIPATTTGYALSAAHVGVDLRAFRRALEAGELDRAVALYSGPFLAGVHLDGASILEHAIEKVRADLEAEYRNALLTLLTGGGEPTEKRVEWAQQLIALDRADARAARLLVRALMDGGRVGQARRAADDYDRWVREELGGTPDPSVTAALSVSNAARAGVADGVDGPSPRLADGTPSPTDPSVGSRGTSAVAGSERGAGTRGGHRRISTAILLVALGLGLVSTLLWQWSGSDRAGSQSFGRVMDPRHVVKHPVYLRVTSLGGDSALASAALVLQEALATAIPRAPAFVGVFRAPEDSVRLALLPGRDSMAAVFDMTVQLSFVADSAMVFLEAENRANPAIATTATLSIGTRLDPLARLDDAVERLVGALALRTDSDSLKTLVYRPPPRFDSYSSWKAGFEVFHGNWDPNRMIPSFLAAVRLDSAWLSPVYYAVRVFDAMEEFNRTDSLIAQARRRMDALPDLRNELEVLARSRAQSRAAIGSTSLPPAEVLLRRQPDASGAQFYETAREYYAASRPGDAATLLARIDSAGGVLSTTDGSSYWLRGLALHSAGEYPQEMALAEERFQRSVSGISHVEYFDYMRALAATGRSAEILERFDDLPSDIVEGDQYIGFGSQLGGEVAFHGDSVVARSLFDRLRQACELRERTLVHYRPRCALAHIARGDTVAARTWVERLGQEETDRLTLLGLRGMVAAASGRTAEARSTLDRIAEYRDNLRQGRPDLWRARVLALLGDREGAITALAAAKENGWFPFWGMHGYFHFYPELASLKDDPRVRGFWIVDGPSH